MPDYPIKDPYTPPPPPHEPDWLENYNRLKESFESGDASSIEPYRRLLKGFLDTPGQSREQIQKYQSALDEVNVAKYKNELTEQQKQTEEKETKFEKDYSAMVDKTIGGLRESLTQNASDFFQGTMAKDIQKNLNSMGLLYSGANPETLARHRAELQNPIEQEIAKYKMGSTDTLAQARMMGIETTLGLEQQKSLAQLNMALTESRNRLIMEMSRISQPSLLERLGTGVAMGAAVGLGAAIGGPIGAGIGGAVVGGIKGLTDNNSESNRTYSPYSYKENSPFNLDYGFSPRNKNSYSLGR